MLRHDAGDLIGQPHFSNRQNWAEMIATSNMPVVSRLAESFAGQVCQPSITPENIAAHGRAIYEAYLAHKVLVFRTQDITAATFAEFGTIFGQPEEHHLLKLRHPHEPTLSLISNQDEPGRNAEMKYSGDGWHSDYSYKLIPGSATMLHGLIIPEEGGDTLFADAEAAFAALPEERKTFLRRLRVRHQYRWSPDRDDPWARWKYIGEEERRKTPEITHPLVRRHPDTGRETLFIQPRIIGSVIGIDGMPEDESTALIEELVAHITSNRYVYRHRWTPLDVVVWDNRCVLHSATTKSLGQRHVRKLLRLTTYGQPVTPSLPEVGHSRLSPVSA
jgi:taurine dioxygenase